MALKRLYLEGWPISKDLFLAMHREVEVALGRESEPAMISEISTALLNALSPASWRDGRAKNGRLLAEMIESAEGVTVVHPGDGYAAVPLGVVVLFESGEQRDRVRSTLQLQDVYCPILWLDRGRDAPARPTDRRFGSRMLVLPCDARYAEQDMERLASLFHRAAASR
jgi:dTDP-4-amino-4,6-dideoxygalactose transaminase